MKHLKIIVLVIAAALFIPLMNGCKKGENDPFLSLKSRDARLKGTWNMKKGEGSGSTSNTQGSTTTTTSYSYSYSSGIGINATTAGGTTTRDTSRYTFEMTINKDGTLECTYSTTDIDWSPPKETKVRTYNSNGRWYWREDKKSKTCIELDIYDSSIPFSGTYYIDELKSKEMILKMVDDESSSTSTTTGSTTITSSDSYTYQSTTTFEKKK
jgi:hypothetical protein